MSGISWYARIINSYAISLFPFNSKLMCKIVVLTLLFYFLFIQRMAFRVFFSQPTNIYQKKNDYSFIKRPERIKLEQNTKSDQQPIRTVAVSHNGHTVIGRFINSYWIIREPIEYCLFRQIEHFRGLLLSLKMNRIAAKIRIINREKVYIIYSRLCFS